MTSAQQYNTIIGHLDGLPSETRLALTCKLYWAGYLTLDELAGIHNKFQADFVTAEANALYEACLPWFQKHNGTQIEYSIFSDFLKATRPFIWDLEVLKTEFAWLYEKHNTVLVNNPVVDHSTARQVLKEGESTPVFVVEWLEERGFVDVGGVLVSRTYQPLVCEEVVTEPILVAIPVMDDKTFTDTFDIVPAMAGGCAFAVLCGPAQLCINYADALGMDRVDTVMLAIGAARRTAEADEDSFKAEFFDEDFLPDYYSVSRTLESNGMVVPFITV